MRSYLIIFIINKDRFQLLFIQYLQQQWYLPYISNNLSNFNNLYYILQISKYKLCDTQRQQATLYKSDSLIASRQVASGRVGSRGCAGMSWSSSAHKYKYIDMTTCKKDCGNDRCHIYNPNSYYMTMVANLALDCLHQQCRGGPSEHDRNHGRPCPLLIRKYFGRCDCYMKYVRQHVLAMQLANHSSFFIRYYSQHIGPGFLVTILIIGGLKFILVCYYVQCTLTHTLCVYIQYLLIVIVVATVVMCFAQLSLKVSEYMTIHIHTYIHAYVHTSYYQFYCFTIIILSADVSIQCDCTCIYFFDHGLGDH